MSIQRTRARLVAGVAGGIAGRLGIHPALVRIAWAVSVPFTMGVSVLVYLVLAALLPVEPEDAPRRADPALVPQAFAAFVLAHGLIHVMGFLPAWRLPAPQGFEYSTLVLYGRVDVGDLGAKALGLAWVALAVAYVLAAAMLWFGHRRAGLVTGVVSVASAVVCALALPLAQLGLAIDVALIAVLLVASRFVLVRAAPAWPSTATRAPSTAR